MSGRTDRWALSFGRSLGVSATACWGIPIEFGAFTCACLHLVTDAALTIYYCVPSVFNVEERLEPLSEPLRAPARALFWAMVAMRGLRFAADAVLLVALMEESKRARDLWLGAASALTLLLLLADVAQKCVARALLTHWAYLGFALFDYLFVIVFFWVVVTIHFIPLLKESKDNRLARAEAAAALAAVASQAGLQRA